WVLGAGVPRVDAVPVPAEGRKLCVDELARRRMPQEVIGRREEEALEVRPPASVETADDGARRRSEIGGLAEPNPVVAFALGDLRDRLHAHTHLEAREALREDAPQPLPRSRGPPPPPPPP